MSALNNLVSEAVDVVVHCVRTDRGPRVGSILAVEDDASGAGSAAFTATEVFSRSRADGPLTWTGDLPVRTGAAFTAAGLDLRDVLGADRR